MPAEATGEALQAGWLHHQAGRLAEAEKLYRQILQQEPDHAEALGLLGMLASQIGKHAAAVEILARVTALKPDYAEAHNNLGIALRSLGRLNEAESSFRRATTLRPNFAQALNNLSVTLANIGRLEEAERNCRQALACDARYADAHANLGMVLRTQRRFDEAAQSYRQALALKPGVLASYGELAATLIDAGRLAEAEPVFREALALDPRVPGAHRDLAHLLGRLGRLEEAEQSYRRALALRPDFALAHDNLGFLLGYLGRMEEALQHTRQALALDPDLAEGCSHVAFMLNYVPGVPPAEIYAAHRAFNQRFGQGAAKQPHRNTRDPERRLRIGYVSGDFRNHAVAFFIEPVLASHDRERIETFCYYNQLSGDQVTRHLKDLAHQWRQIESLSDGALADLVRADGIDILVDLNGHTTGHRLKAFALCPAPVQATWLGYLNTTGLDAVGYRITDPRASPASVEAYHSEKLVRLPDSQWCYQPPTECPQVGELPSATSGVVTFAAFTGPAKTGKPVVELWREVLARVPRSRLLVQIGGFTSIPPEYVERFATAGIARERVEFVGGKNTLDYFALRHGVDVVLDTFPCTGGTTTCDSLWMGVPVVTLVGDTPYSRGGASLLHAVGLQDLIAQSPEEYVAIAARLADDTRRLAQMRAGLRERMRASPLMDAERFTRNLEAAYRQMWHSWCGSR